MFEIQTIERFVDVSKFVKCKGFINYNIIQESDKTISIVFEKTNDESKNKIYDFKEKLRIRTPLCLQKFNGKQIAIYNENINSSIKELFRIKPINFNIDNISGIRYVDPYFTSTTLIVPFFYVNKHLDDVAPILRVSMKLTNDLILKKGQIRAEFTVIKDGDFLNYPLYKTTNGIKTKTMHKLISLVNDNNKGLEKFIYLKTVGVSFNKYGVMIFQEEK